MNVQHSLIQELMHYKFKMGFNTVKATKDICYTKDEDRVDQSTVSRWFKKFCTDCMKLNDQARSGRPKTLDFKAIEVNLASHTQRLRSASHSPV